MSLLKKLAGETAIYGLSSILGRLLNYVLLTPYLTRVFNTESYGIISDVYAYVALLTVIFTYRFSPPYYRFLFLNWQVLPVIKVIQNIYTFLLGY
jgi:O-antigen/teichoic acid export membrane protein